MAKFMTYESWKLVEKNLIKKLVPPVGTIIINDLKNFNPNKYYEDTVWERIKGRVIAGIDENDTDTNKKTSFNQASGTLIGNKWLHSHGHSWVGVNDGASIGYSPGVYPFRIYQDVGVNWTGTSDHIRKAGSGDAQNIQPTYLSYMWKRIS